MSFDPFDPRLARLEPEFSSSHLAHMREWLATNKREFRAEQRGGSGGGELELAIMDVIGGGWFWEGITAKKVKRALDAAPNVGLIRVLINSPGGVVWDGVAIHALLKRHRARVEIEVLGEAASAASVVAMAGDRISVHEGAFFMVHEAWTVAGGKAAELRETADLLDKINDSMVDLYTRRTGKPREQIVELVRAETWMSAQDAFARGFADEVIPGKAPEKAPDKEVGRAPQDRARGRASAAASPLRQLLSAGALGRENRYSNRPTLGAFMRKPWT
ncbi:MAG: Clp protease ClpP [Pseudomonadota bacterium]